MNQNDLSSQGNTPLLSVRNLSVDFVGASGERAHALEDVSFDVYPGQTLGLVGESGCGKTTTLLAVMRLLPSSGRITNGEVLWAKDEPRSRPLFTSSERGERVQEQADLLSLSEAEMRRYRWRKMAIVFQGAMNALNPVATVGEQIAEAILQHETLERSEAARRVEALLDLVGIARSRMDQYPHQYSGGMRQRAMIAMALACRPRLLFADEPTTALDVMIQAQVLDLLQNIQAELGLAVVLVTHDLGVIAEMCDSAVVLYGGKVAEYAPVDALYNAPLHPYTQRLLGAFPDLNRPIPQVGEAGYTLASIPGAPPRLNDLPPGCRFEPRCHRRTPLCALRAPELVDVSIGPKGFQKPSGPDTPPDEKDLTGFQKPIRSETPVLCVHRVACHLLDQSLSTVPAEGAER